MEKLYVKQIGAPNGIKKGVNMTTTEILEEIHKERVELEVCHALQQWLLNDRDMWIGKAMDGEATVRAIRKIATETNNPKNALQEIVNLSEGFNEDPIEESIEEAYYKDHRLKVVINQSRKYDVYDNKYGRITHKDVSKEQADKRIQEILNVRNRQKTKG